MTENLSSVGSSLHDWAWSTFRAIRATQYELGIRVDDMDTIDITALRQHITQHALLGCRLQLSSVISRVCLQAL